ncbi:glycosyltransferase family 4 protein [Halobacterium sp. KA-6]|uniref:glycosyltransferase family 4 protein n=1 Tax=Halobacterium sp. KA-6 TaxID=2896368 RepID=UPI001E40B7A9|nr:glycosyltransferase family 4 protein [Halobacterium sp. KA-6]MCD2205022.1 glycosyltransferase family 4 protein [Halobacterium sp. KA-6]
MRILFVTHRYPPHTGGVETHVQEIATRLADRGHDVTVFSADAGSGVPSEHTDDGVRVRRFRSVSPGGAFYVAPQMTLAVRRANVDVVHAHNYHAFPLFFAALGVTDERFVVTTHYHGESASGFRDVLLSIYQPFGRWAVRQANEVIAVSEWEQERLKEDFRVDATVIPNGVDVERFADAKPEERECPYLLCVGRLEEYKGVQHVIRALPDLPDYDLVVAGSGPYREELERVARNEGVASRVNLLGYVDHDRLPRLYSGADVYITLSEFESYGMTVAEALAAETPCVVRGTGALTDWTEENSVVSLTDIDPVIIANAITTVEKRQVHAELSRWNDVVHDTTTIYREQEL